MFLLLAIICYSLTTLYILWGLVKQKPLHKGMTLLFLLIGSLAHTITLYPQVFTLYGLNFNVFNIISLTSLFMLLFYGLFCLYRPILVLGILATPLALLGVVLGYIGNSPYQPLTHLTFSLQAHIILSLAGYCVLFMAAVQAIILRLQIRELKHHTIHRLWVERLPALQSMESLLFDMIMVGFILLSFALAFGFIDVTDLFEQHLVHKTVFSLASWLIFGILLFGHWRFGWRGVRATNMVIYGTLLLMIAFIGTKFVLEIILKRV